MGNYNMWVRSTSKQTKIVLPAERLL